MSDSKEGSLLRTLSELGLSNEDIIDRLVSKLEDRIMRSDLGDECDTGVRSRLKEEIMALVKDQISKTVESEFSAGISSHIEQMKFPQTTGYGETKAEPLSLREYMTKIAVTWLTEKVTSKGEKPTHYDQAVQTRVTHMVHAHLHGEIGAAIKLALASANDEFSSGIAETAKMKLEEISRSINGSIVKFST